MQRVSVVVPIYNEVENVPLLCESLVQVLDGLGREYEVVLVDDGSTDGSAELLAQLAAENPRLKVIEFRRNYGQTAAMRAGIEAASGEAVVTIDGDLQNEPGDIPRLLAKLDEGYDLVHGWRKNRRDPFWHRKLPSLAANWLISRVTGFPVHDLGCTLKAMRAEHVKELRMYGEMHRFIPILAHWQGARCVEIVTRHHPRRFGRTKYGLWRTVRVILDLITVKYMTQYSASPMKLFGGIGLLLLGASFCSGIATAAMKIAGGVDMTGNPLLLLTALTGIVSVQFFVLGLLGEVTARIYHECQDKRPYAVRRCFNLEQNDPAPVAAKRAA